MERIVICDECGHINNEETARVKDRGGVIGFYFCENCGYGFFKPDWDVKRDNRKVMAENKSRLGKSLKELEKSVEGWGEERRELKLIANLLIEIGRKKFKKG